jgi:hypothetical protein
MRMRRLDRQDMRSAMASSAETGRSKVVYPRLRTRRQVTEPSEGEPIDVAEDKARTLKPQHIELMTEDENFGVQRNSGPEQPGHNAPDHPQRSTIAPNILDSPTTPDALSLRYGRLDCLDGTPLIDIKPKRNLFTPIATAGDFEVDDRGSSGSHEGLGVFSIGQAYRSAGRAAERK